MPGRDKLYTCTYNLPSPMRRACHSPQRSTKHYPPATRAYALLLAMALGLGSVVSAAKGIAASPSELSVEAPAASTVVSSSRCRPLPARSGWCSNMALLLASDSAPWLEYQQDSNDSAGPELHGYAGSDDYLIAHATVAAIFDPLHDVAECARRGMRTSGRQPPI